jgi:hypothetical protein
MPFTLIKGRFKPLVGNPDGDSVRFLADDLLLWDRLEGSAVELGPETQPTKDTAQLRFEGIDSIEKQAIEPLATDSRQSMLNLIGFDATNNPEPSGYILARMTDDQSGRPICFVFSGEDDRPDGDSVFLEAPELRNSVNYKQVDAGFAYPLYYNTLFAELRNEFNVALAAARAAGRGYWPQDQTMTGVTVQNRGDLKTISPIWPKLWRRLDTYLSQRSSLECFVDYLLGQNERVDILSEMDEKGLQDIVEVIGDQVRLTQPPENIRVIGDAGLRHR